MPNATPNYTVQIYNFADTTTYGVGSLLATLNLSKNLGWAKYLNDVPDAFFTIDQDDPQAKLLRGLEGRLHCRIYRGTDIVWAGWAAMEHDATARDVIFYCYGYLSGLFWTASDWNKVYTGQTAGAIVADQWAWAQAGQANSRLGFVATGTIEAPVTTTGGGTAIIVPVYKAFYKRVLFIMREMTSLSLSDTANNVVFEITHSATPTFNFWKNKGTDQANVVWRYTDSIISNYNEIFQPVFRRNDVLAVGSSPMRTLLRSEWTNPSDIVTWGRMAESVYFRWARDVTEVQRAAAFRGALATRDNIDLTLEMRPNSVIPPGATGATFDLADRVNVIIDRGITNINGYYLVRGVQVIVQRGVEKVKVLLEQRTGT